MSGIIAIISLVVEVLKLIFGGNHADRCEAIKKLKQD